MQRALIVTSIQKDIEELSRILAECGVNEYAYSASGSEARRMLLESDYEIVLINSPLTDEFGNALAVKATESNAGIIFLVRSEIAEQVSQKLEVDGIYVVGKPVNKPLFYQAVRMAVATNRRIVGIRQENVELKTKIEAIRTVDRAKCILIQYLSMTEVEAHKFIERQAMDMRITRKEVAEGIIRTYETN